jgi:RimJ/RimL family protein N-acetyltransferase
MEFTLLTERLILRRLMEDDFADLSEMLFDPDVMYAWEHTFNETQVQEWIDNQFGRYKQTGVGVFAAIEKETGKMVGQFGLVWGDIEGENVLELTYMLKKSHFGKGFAVEASKACLDHAFNEIGVDKIYAPVRPENRSSRIVAENLGFKVCGEYVIHYNGKDMPHLFYVLDKKSQNKMFKKTTTTKQTK